jgi:subtilisin family serine protease
LIFQVSLNRRVLSALDRSVPAVKGDAARTLFSVDSRKIAWAVLDSGIDAAHPAFLDADGTKTRVRKTFDFTRVRALVSADNDRLTEADLTRLLDGVRMSKAEARRRLRELRRDCEEQRPVNWDVVEELLTLEDPSVPPNPHGTHVAGILGARQSADTGRPGGMCPEIQLYDFRVLARSLEDTEFAVIAALQYIRYVNERHSYITIHGANLSLSIPHNVRNYACGRTPICNECQRLVDGGVVVVAAAGNRGYQRFETKEGLFENYAAFSITDPGNADDVITVGATHGNWPHTYGVSFFSSRGPTGDGRVKPDLVAPGERIQAPVPHGEWRAESGTSMAAPHVSGAAAMLMARYPELIGNPRRVKRILCDSATDLGRERSFQGHGMLDVLRAFQSI